MSRALATLAAIRAGMPAGLAPPPFSELAAGEGGLVELDGHMVAGYRDDDGALHAVSPACSRRGCLVAFNNAERTWDCPCHGSRFDVDGHVIAGTGGQGS